VIPNSIADFILKIVMQLEPLFHDVFIRHDLALISCNTKFIRPYQTAQRGNRRMTLTCTCCLDLTPSSRSGRSGPCVQWSTFFLVIYFSIHRGQRAKG
jgi:hypothetical protein